MSVVIAPPPFQYLPNNNNSGSPAAGFKLFTYVAGTTTKQNTWTDSTQGTPNANPILLDANGFIAASSGSGLWLDPTLLYKFVWALPTDTDPPTSPLRTEDNVQGPINLTVLTSSVIGSILYPQTAAETAAGVTPTNFAYPELNILRYGADPTATNDSATAINNALSVASKIGLAWVEVPNVQVSGSGGAIYKCNSLLQLSSTNNVGIIGTHGMPWLKYTGAAANTDGPTGAFLNFTGGNNESFGGVMNLNIDCNFSCAHGIYAPGILNVNFLIDNVKVRWANLDGFNMTANASGGSVLWQMTRCACYPAVPTATSGFSKIAVVGRYPINIGLDTNSGTITIRDFASDNGVSGFIAQQSTTNFGASTLFLDHIRFEMNDTGLPCVVQNFRTATVPALYMRACEFVDATASTNAGATLVQNLSTAGGIRGPVTIEQLVWNGVNNGATSLADIYTDAASAAFTLSYDAKLLNTKIELNNASIVSRFPTGTALNGSALPGQYTVDPTGHVLYLMDANSVTNAMQFGNPVTFAAANAQAGALGDTGKIFDNNSNANFVYTLPAISTLPAGWLSPLIYVVTAGTPAMTANAADKIGSKAGGSSYTAGNTVGNAFQVRSCRGIWVPVVNVGFT